jgi:hypothetical protein
MLNKGAGVRERQHRYPWLFTGPEMEDPNAKAADSNAKATDSNAVMLKSQASTDK